VQLVGYILIKFNYCTVKHENSLIFVQKSGDVTDKTACKYEEHIYTEKTCNETARGRIFFFEAESFHLIWVLKFSMLGNPDTSGL